MKKIIRTNNLQKALEDYDALKGQAVSYVSELPVSPNIRNSVYCKQTTTDVEDSLNITVESLIQDYAEKTETADHYVIPVTYTVEYLGIAVRAIEVSGDTAIMYEDADFTTALAASFNLEDKYLFAVTTHVTEMAYYIGDVTNQTLHPVVSFGVIAEVNKRIDVVERELDDKADVSALVQLDNKIDNSYNTLDNKIDNEISNLAVNFTTNNLVANVASINNAVIDNAQVNNFDVSSIIANGSTGSDGQVLGKVNGNVEWFSPSLDTNDFKVNYLTVNNSSVTDNATINNLVVNNATLPRTVTKEVSYLYENGQPVEDPGMIEVINEQVGFGNAGITNVTYNLQFLPFITMPESEYNNSLICKGNKAWSGDVMGFFRFSAYQNIISDPVLAFVATAPFGNIYFAGKKIADANCDVKVEKLSMGKYLDSSSLPIISTSTPTSSLVFTDAPVTNNLLDFRLDVKVTSILGSDVCNESMTNLPYGLDINMSNGVITTNIKNTYFIDFQDLFLGCHAMTDCFLTNPSLIVNAPSGYNVWNGITSMHGTFRYCYNFNQPITIPDSVIAMPNTFEGCYNFNQPITIPKNVARLAGTFRYCYNFNQPITIPDSVIAMPLAFAGCNNFNQPITIPKKCTGLWNTFENCTKLASSTVPIHISKNIALGNTSDYIYNMLVNGYTGITFDPSRILNDA